MHWWLSLALAVAALPAPTSTSAAPLSLAEARRVAAEASPDVQRADVRIRLAEADVTVAGALPNPSATVTSAVKTARLGVALSVPLPVFGRRGAAIAASREDVTTTAREAALARLDARLGVSVAYVDLWAAGRREGLFEDAAKYADRMRAIAAERHEAGLGAEIDVVRAGADAARARAEWSSAGGALRSAGARLQPWLGAAAPPVVTPGLPTPPLPDFAALSAALDRHPLVVRDEAAVSAAGARTRLEETLRWPQPSAELTTNINDPSLPGNDFIAGFAVELPVLSRREGEIARATAAVREAELASRLDRAALQAELGAAFEEARAASLALATFRGEVLPALERTRAMTEEGFRAGRLDLVRLLDAQRALRDAALAEVDARATYVKSLAAVERASGTDLLDGVPDAP